MQTIRFRNEYGKITKGIVIENHSSYYIVELNGIIEGKFKIKVKKEKVINNLFI